MSRGNDLGRDFDDQWHDSRRKGQERAARGEGPWAIDHRLEKRQQSLEVSGAPQSGGRHAKPSSDSCVTALGLLGGLAWAITEAIGRIAS